MLAYLECRQDFFAAVFADAHYVSARGTFERHFPVQFWAHIILADDNSFI